jgi:hypothetical protein
MTPTSPQPPLTLSPIGAKPCFDLPNALESYQQGFQTLSNSAGQVKKVMAIELQSKVVNTLYICNSTMVDSLITSRVALFYTVRDCKRRLTAEAAAFMSARNQPIRK